MLQDLIIRIMVGVVFLSEGAQKFLFHAELGSGRFARLGVPYAEPVSYIVASAEVICAAMILGGIRVRAAVWPLFGVVAGAVYFSRFPELVHEGFWRAAHDSRADFCMACGLLYLARAYWKRGAN